MTSDNSANNDRIWANLEYASGVLMPLSIRPGATETEVSNSLYARLHHLEAMLALTYGDGGEALECLDDEIREKYLWACASLAGECRAIFDVLESRRECPQ